MMIAKTFFDRLGIKKLQLNINSIGCRKCRKDYNEALKEYLRSKLDKMCPTCRERFEKNPLRILDCKEEGCKAITAGAPVILDYLCDDCRAHHESVCAQLTKLGIDFKVNPHIVRGLDYYTRTVFEFISSDIGAQGTVSGGGRYNDLIEDVGGKPCPAVGFGMGLERLILTMEARGDIRRYRPSRQKLQGSAQIREQDGRALYDSHRYGRDRKRRISGKEPAFGRFRTGQERGSDRLPYQSEINFLR